MTKAIEKTTAIPTIRESTHQIYLAGLGALSLAEDESGKLFKALIKRGKTFEATTKDRADALKAKLNLRKAASDTIDRIGDTVDEGVSEALNRIGLPSKKEIDNLTKRVERLTKAIETAPAPATRRRVTRHREKVATA